MHSLNVAINGILLLVAVFAIAFNEYKIHFFICVLSISIGMFGLGFLGPDIQTSQIIALLMFTKTGYLYWKRKTHFTISKALIYEYVILIIGGIYFGFVSPWYDPQFPRQLQQSAHGRTVITWGRELCDIAIVYYTYYMFSKKKVTYSFFLECLFYCILMNTLVAVLGYFTPYELRTILLGARELPGRFCGFDSEPKHFGKNALYSFFLFVIYLLTSAKTTTAKMKKICYLGCIICIVNVIFAGSTSTIVIFLVCSCVAVVFINWNPLLVLSERYFLPVFLIIVLLIIGMVFFINTRYYEDHFKTKIDKVTGVNIAKPSFPGEPKLFRQWEIWDRYAADYLYQNPKFLLFGVGPNLIHIPMTRYATKDELRMYGGSLNNVPRMGWLYILSRSGLVGLAFYFLMFRKVLLLSYKYRNKFIFLLTIVTIIFIGLTLDYWLYFSLGFFLYSLDESKKKFYEKANTIS